MPYLKKKYMVEVNVNPSDIIVPRELTPIPNSSPNVQNEILPPLTSSHGR